MNHLIITIDLPVDERMGKLLEHEAEFATKEAYKAARKALLHFTGHSDEDYSFKIES